MPCRETGSKTRKVKWSKCEGTSLLGTEHTGCPSLIILSLFTLIHQHKYIGGALQNSPLTAPLWGVWWRQPSQAWKVICQKLRHIFPGRALIFWKNPCSSQRWLGGTPKILASWWNTAGRDLLWVFFLIKIIYSAQFCFLAALLIYNWHTINCTY